MNKSALIIAASLLASRVLGVVREMLLASIAGVGGEKAALDLAFLIPDILNHVVGTGFLSIVFISLFTSHLIQNDEEGAWRAFSNLFNVLGVALLALIVPCFIWMKELILLATANNPDPLVLERSVHFARIILPGQFFFLAGAFLVAAQQTRNQFLIPSLAGIVYNLSIVGGGWLLRDRGVEGFAWGVPVGAFVGQVALQLLGTKLRGGFRYMPVFHTLDKELIKSVKMLVPMVLGVGAMFGIEFVIRSFGSGFGESGVPALNYAYRLMYTLVAVFGFSVAAAKYPKMTRMFQEGKAAELTDSVFTSLTKIFAILVPAILVLMALSLPATRILFEHGAFDAKNSDLVSRLLLWYLPASIGLCGTAVVTRLFYAANRPWTPMIWTTGIFALSIPFYLWLAPLGIISVPLVSSVTVVLQLAALLVVWLKDEPVEIDFRKHFKNFLIAFLVLLVYAPICLFLANYLAPRFWEMGLVGLCAASVGIAVAVFGLAFVAQRSMGSTAAEVPARIARMWRR
jgi:putative peptidoglycan lipid II flippase